DGASDGIEKLFGGDPTVADLDNFADSDGDGLVNIVEKNGWVVTITKSSILLTGVDRCKTACSNGESMSHTQTSDPLIADSDFDGLLDGEERELGTDPTSKDSDGDGITDLQEVKGVEVHNLGVIWLDPLDQDTDNDGLSDGEEARFVDGTFVDNELERWIVRPFDKAPYLVVSDPLQADADFDTLVDGNEKEKGSDPTLADTDDDGVFDGDEFDKGTNLLSDSISVTVGFEKIHFLQERKGEISSTDGDFSDWYVCDRAPNRIERNPGEFNFNFGVRPPLSESKIAVNSNTEATDGPKPLSIRTCNAPQFIVGVEEYDSACRLGNLIYVPAVWNGSIGNYQVADLSLENKSVTFDISAGEEFTIIDQITEKDTNALNVDDAQNGFPFSLDTTNSLFLEGEDVARSATISVDELSTGITKGTFKKRGGFCEFDIDVFIRKQ
ncbi:MAG: hypothetical protein ACU85E_14345, partial [Gammaproteobacteria bacterium]